MKRFVRLPVWVPRHRCPFRRMECGPGEEAQVDFGSGGTIVASPTAIAARRTSFGSYSVIAARPIARTTFRQTTEDFFRCLRERVRRTSAAIHATLVIDNLKAAVAHADWFDPEITPKVQSFCQHYGTVILPTRPYMPRHKGKVEAGVKYVKNNALKGRTFASLEEQNRFLSDWERTVADTRIHGTTKAASRQGVSRSRTGGTATRCPSERFPFFHEAQRKVNRDGHVEVAKAYYSAPTEYLGREVWARWDARLVRLFNHRWEQIAVHVRHEKGRFSTHAAHIAPEKINGLEKGARTPSEQSRCDR